MELGDTEKSIQDNIQMLSRGLMQPSYSLVYDAYKNLYKIGKPVVEILKQKILEIDWSKSKYKELSAYASGIFSLLHDIDENDANKLRQLILENGCPKHIKAILNSVCEFSLKNYKKYELFGIDIFEHKHIKSNCSIGSYLKKWLENIPSDDLKEISRIYVVRREDIDLPSASGTYMSVLFKIALLWENNYREDSFLFKLFVLSTEHTFYHEIGHHFYKHTSKQDRSDKEREADRYAYKIMKKEHPYLHFFVGILLMIGYKSERNYYRWGL